MEAVLVCRQPRVRAGGRRGGAGGGGGRAEGGRVAEERGRGSGVGTRQVARERLSNQSLAQLTIKTFGHGFISISCIFPYVEDA